jgi:ribosomal protein S18 acetylase RimI-like enzyme
MKAGKILHQFTAKDGRKVLLRTPKWEDLDDFLEYINALVDEGADIVQDQKATRDQEADWLGTMLARLEKGERFSIVAEVEGKAISIAELWRKKGYQSHVGGVCLGISKNYRDIGIGTQLMTMLISHAKTIGLKILTLEVYATNKRAIHVYKKVGFKETGRIPKGLYRHGNYIDEVLMTKKL